MAPAPIRARYHPQRGQKVPRRGVFLCMVGSDREWRAQEKKAPPMDPESAARPHAGPFLLRFPLGRRLHAEIVVRLQPILALSSI